MTRLSWHLEITDMAEYERTKEFFHCTQVENFFTLSEVWKFLGGKLKRERNGYAGERNGYYYCLTKM